MSAILTSFRIPASPRISSSRLPALPARLPVTARSHGYRSPPATDAAFKGIDRLVASLVPISLAELNAKAEMLQRRDNKYVVRGAVLREAMAELARHFDVLEIDGRREFTYETCYFDDEARTSYFDHHRGRRKRCKVRVRRYVDAGLCFVEIKLKDRRGLTVKKRLKYAPEKFGTLDEAAWAHIRTAYRGLYGQAFGLALQPVLEMRYRRVTLVAKRGEERMTIDCGLLYRDGEGRHQVDEDLFIVETKSANANGIADKILRALHQHPTKRCSKYCTAVAALRQVRKHNRFLVALRKLAVLPSSAAALAAGATPALPLPPTHETLPCPSC